MLVRTHIVIGAFLGIVFWRAVDSPIAFGIMVLIGSVLPDIDNAFSNVGSFANVRNNTAGNNVFGNMMQGFQEHRGFIHSLTCAFILSVVLAVFIPVLAFGFFLGYAIHLFADSFTREGVVPFWPYSGRAHGMLVKGSMSERAIFFVFAFLDIVAVLLYFIGF